MILLFRSQMLPLFHFLFDEKGLFQVMLPISYQIFCCSFFCWFSGLGNLLFWAVCITRLLHSPSWLLSEFITVKGSDIEGINMQYSKCKDFLLTRLACVRTSSACQDEFCGSIWSPCNYCFQQMSFPLLTSAVVQSTPTLLPAH